MAPLPTAPLSPPEKLACLRLIRSENVGAVAFRELINLCGGAQQALDAIPEITRRAGRRGGPFAFARQMSQRRNLQRPSVPGPRPSSRSSRAIRRR
jgi:DNA processing protein